MKTLKKLLKKKTLGYLRVSAANPSGSIISQAVLLFPLETCPFVGGQRDGGPGGQRTPVKRKGLSLGNRADDMASWVSLSSSLWWGRSCLPGGCLMRTGPYTKGFVCGISVQTSSIVITCRENAFRPQWDSWDTTFLFMYLFLLWFLWADTHMYVSILSFNCSLLRCPICFVLFTSFTY